VNHHSRQPADCLDLLLEARNPVDPSKLRTAGIEGALDELGADIAIRSRRGPRRSRGVSARVALVAAAVIVATVGVAAAGWSAHTGIFQPTKEQIASAEGQERAQLQSEVDMGGPGELLNAAAPDFREVALQVGADIPYPEGYESWRDFLIFNTIRTATGKDVVSEGALHGWFAASAFVAWIQAWRQAEMAGDAEGAAQAAQVIAQAPSWKAVTDEDPHPNPSAPGDEGSKRPTLFGWMLPYRDAVVAGDRARVEQLLATAYGSWSYTSDPPWNAQLDAHPEWSKLPAEDMARRYEEFLAAGRPGEIGAVDQDPATTEAATTGTDAPVTTIQPQERP